MAAGTYWVIIKTDAAETLPEIDESDNAIVLGPIEIKVPDLVVTGVVPPAKGWSGQTIDVNWT